MNLTERYVHAVTRHLPENQREDVAEELRATIEDMAADHAKGKKPGQKDIEAALIKLGNPDKLAAKYTHTPRHLIGSKWYDMYLNLLKQLLSIIPPIVGSVILLINLAAQKAVAASIVEAVGTAITVGIHIFFWVTIGFVIAERSGANPNSIDKKANTWTPSDLPALPNKQQIGTGDIIAASAFNIVAAALLVLGFHTSAWAGDSASSLLNPAIWMPWGITMLGIIVVSLLQELYKLKTGRWTLGLAVFNTLLNIATIALVVHVFKTQEVLNPDFIRNVKDINIDAVGHVATVIVTTLCAMDSLDGIRKAFASKRTK
jgi:hypothetical protein